MDKGVIFQIGKERVEIREEGFYAQGIVQDSPVDILQ